MSTGWNLVGLGAALFATSAISGCSPIPPIPYIENIAPAISGEMYQGYAPLGHARISLSGYARAEGGLNAVFEDEVVFSDESGRFRIGPVKEIRTSLIEDRLLNLRFPTTCWAMFVGAGDARAAVLGQCGSGVAPSTLTVRCDLNGPEKTFGAVSPPIVGTCETVAAN